MQRHDPPKVSGSEEIEVEVVEVGESRPVDGSQPSTSQPSKSHHSQGPYGGTRKMPFQGRFRTQFRGDSPMRTIRIPFYLWPLALIFGLILFLLAIAVGLLIAIPFLIIRAILRLFR